MTELCAIEADYVNWRPVNGRKVLQLVFEVPLENTHDVLTRLGTPTPGESKWCAIALLDHDAVPVQRAEAEDRVQLPTPQPQAEGGSPKKWSEYARSQQAAILCRDPAFWVYFGVEDTNDAIHKLRIHFKIRSRSEFDTDPLAGARWDEFVALYNLHRERHK